MTRAVALIGLLLALLTLPALAVQPDEILKDPALEARARALSAQLRCLKCQNQSIDDSDADIARDLRLLVRERLTKGDSDNQVLDYLVARYGEFVLLEPKFGGHTLLLWLAPLALILAGGMAVVMFYRSRRGRLAETPLSEREQADLDALMRGDD